MGYVGNSSLDIFRHDINCLQMVHFWKFKQLRSLIITVFSIDGVKVIQLFLIFGGLTCLQESHFSRNGEMSNWTVNNDLKKFISEQILLQGKRFFEICYWYFAHVHECTNVEFINPMDIFINSKDRSLAAFSLRVDEPSFDLFFIILWIFLPIIELWFLANFYGILQGLR